MSIQRYGFYGNGVFDSKHDGGYVHHEDYAALEAKCSALAAEKEKFAVECAATKIAIAYMKSGRQDFTLNTPATDAFLAEVRAQGADAVADQHRRKYEGLKPINVFFAKDHMNAQKVAELVAAQLRQDANTAELEAAGIITKVGE